jgi:uncharacterized protein (DUF2147 family)
MKSMSILFLSMNSIALIAQNSVVGLWQAIDDIDNKPTSHIKIEKINNQLRGTIVKLMNVNEDVTCQMCSGDKKNQPIKGMEILWDLSEDKDQWNGGRIIDPKSGKTYKCLLYLDGEDTLKVRGYVGISALGRTQTWKRVK